MKEKIQNETVVQFLNLPSEEQMLFILNLKLEQFLKDKYQSSLNQENK